MAHRKLEGEALTPNPVEISKSCDSVEETDVVLHVEGEMFVVSRRGLAELSPYFRALFYGGGHESRSSHIEIKGVGVEQFRLLMGFARTSSLALDRENVLEVLRAADFLQLERARLRCCKFLERELHMSNCVGMLWLAWQLGCVELYSAARAVALTHLPALACQQDFLHLPKDALVELLSSQDLVVPNEDLAFEALLCWATFDPGREDDFLELAGLVRPECLTLSYISEMLTSVKGSDMRAKLICKLDKQPPSSWIVPMCSPRTRVREIVYVLGGPHDQDKQTLYQFHPNYGLWQSCSPFKRKNITQYAVAAVGDSVTVSGGYFRDEVVWYSVDWVRVYNCSGGVWRDGPALNRSRHSHCAAAVGLQLCVLGGSMDQGPTADVEMWLLGDEAWHGVSPMVQAVERAACASTGARVYVACGLDENGEVYGGVQRYQVETDQWDVVSCSPFPRYDLLATVLNGALYFFGGQAMRLDVETDEWTTLEEVCLDNKFYTGCTTANGQVYLVGERKGNRVKPNLILLDPYTDTCIEMETHIPCPVPIRGCVTVRHCPS